MRGCEDERMRDETMRGGEEERMGRWDGVAMCSVQCSESASVC
jgi:hypothetical protein